MEQGALQRAVTDLVDAHEELVGAYESASRMRDSLIQEIGPLREAARERDMLLKARYGLIASMRTVRAEVRKEHPDLPMLRAWVDAVLRHAEEEDREMKNGT